jgi:hypothetical protein
VTSSCPQARGTGDGRRWLTPWRRVTSLLLLVLVGCGDRPRPPTHRTTTVRDSSGIQIVENPENPPDSVGWSIGKVPTLVIGDDEAKGRNYLFGRIAGARRMSDGRIVVADMGLTEVRLYDPAGVYVGRVGGAGSGPGEFKAVGGVMLLSDSILVPSFYFGRDVKLYAPDATFVRSWSPPDPPEGPGGGYQPGAIAGLFGDGSLLVSFLATPRTPPPAAYRAPSRIDRSQRLLRVAANGRILTDFGELPYGGMIRYDNGVHPGFAITDAPYLARPRGVPAGTELYFAAGSNFQIEVYDSLAALRRIIRKQHSPFTFSRAWADSVWRTTINGMPPEFEWLHGAEPPEMRNAPAIDRLLVDSEGMLWVRSGGADQMGVPRWFVFDGAGVLRHSLRSELDPQQIGNDYVLTVERDVLGVETVAIYPLHRR